MKIRQYDFMEFMDFMVSEKKTKKIVNFWRRINTQ